VSFVVAVLVPLPACRRLSPDASYLARAQTEVNYRELHPRAVGQQFCSTHTSVAVPSWTDLPPPGMGTTATMVAVAFTAVGAVAVGCLTYPFLSYCVRRYCCGGWETPMDLDGDVTVVSSRAHALGGTTFFNNALLSAQGTPSPSSHELFSILGPRPASNPSLANTTDRSL
jgi:hypothetical protein